MAQAKQQALRQAQPTIITLGKDGSSLVAPVTLAGKPIGAFQLHQLGTDSQASPWTEEDLALVETILDQVAQIAENLRLFDETRERASFEQVVGEISQKLRQASSMETLVKTAAEELSRVLGTSHSLVRVGNAPQEQTATNQPAQGRQNGKPE
jgi:GAF domain-containing protein